MIMRLFLLFGLVLLGGTGWFIVVETPPTVQAAPAVGEYARLREEGIIPEGEMFENEEIEHDVFGVPPEDEAMIEAAEENMDMGDMDMGDGDGQMDMADSGATEMVGDGAMDSSGAEMPSDGAMNMDGDGQMDMADSGATAMDGDGAMDPSTAEMPSDSAMNMDGDGQMDMADSGTMEMAEGEEASAASEEEADRLMAGRMAGLVITDEGEFDREITISMSEWTFSDLEIDAKPGERIRFTLRNEGQTLHEFMFMSMAAMQGVTYRAKRADWNLLEHEALYEKSLLLPGDEITFVAEIARPGVWMFMCMVPYHMQMGMMGQLATEGMAMEM